MMVTDQREKWIIYGSCVASLVLAERLANNNKDVKLVNPSNGWAHIFSGIEINDERFDFGMNNFEFDLFSNQSRNIDSYDPESLNSLAKYTNFVKEYLLKFISIHKLSHPKMLISGNFIGDAVLANQLDVLDTLSHADRKNIYQQLNGTLANKNNLHPSLKYSKNSIHEMASYYESSVKNHGLTFHNLIIEPFVQKVLGVSSRLIPSIYHRSAWAPLFYPETLKEYLDTKRSPLKQINFHYPNNQSFGVFVSKIVNSLEQNKNVEFISAIELPNIDLQKKFITLQKTKLIFDRFVWAEDIFKLTKILKIHESKHEDENRKRSSVLMSFIKVSEMDDRFKNSVITDLDQDSSIYRVTNQTVCSNQIGKTQKLVFESNVRSWNELGMNDTNIFYKFLEKFGIQEKNIISHNNKTFNGMAIPSIAEREVFIDNKSSILNHFGDIFLIGKSGGYRANTLNDQIIQALKIIKLEGLKL